MNKYLIIDLEATCWEDKQENWDKKSEIVEIGYSLVSDKEILLSAQSILIKPVLNPILSQFCKNLTHIKQEDVDNAQTFVNAFRNFEVSLYLPIFDPKVYFLNEYILCSWGFYDNRILKEICENNHIDYPFGRHISLKHKFAEKHNLKRPVGVLKALRMLNLEFEGQHHRGKDDVANITKIFFADRMWEYIL